MPNEYGQVDDKVADTLHSLKFRTGSDPEWPDYEMRKAMYKQLVGARDDDTAFYLSAASLKMAATNYAQGAVLHGTVGGTAVVSAGEPALRQAFADALSELQGVLSVVDNTATLRSTAKLTGSIFSAATFVLSSASVARAFGVEPAPATDWPITAKQSGAGALLIDRASTRLSKPNLQPTKMQTFFALQRTARYGSDVIGAALAYDGDVDSDPLREAINNAYSWATASQKS
jgi:hypothetical protein